MKTSALMGLAVAAGAVAATLALAGSPATAAQPTRVNNCVHPISGISLNEFFGVPEQFVSRICEGPTVGEHWRPIMNYFGAEAADAVYPPGYVPLHAAPVDDILAKVTIKVVIDRGTRQQKTYGFSPTDRDTFRTDHRVHELNPNFPDLPSFFIMPRMAPLSRGHHTYEIIWVQSAAHCDGISTDPDISCLPAGESPAAGGPVDFSLPKPVAP
jgi:hypothetical protein